MKQGIKKASQPKQSSGSLVVGRAAFAKISAVEGIRMSLAMEQEFQEFDRKGLSPEERRRLIGKKYAGVR
jgi:hypothetical protein